MTNESDARKATLKKKVDYLIRQIAAQLAEQAWVIYMRDLYFSCFGFGENLNSQLQTEYEIQTSSGQFWLQQYKDSCKFQTLFNLLTAMFEILVTLGIGTIAKAYQLSRLGINLFNAFKIMDFLGNINQICQLTVDFKYVFSDFDKMELETKRAFIEALKEEVKRVFEQRFEAEMQQLPQNERFVLALYFQFEEAARNLSLDIVGIDYREERRVKAYIRELLKTTNKILAEKKVYEKIFESTPGPSLWAIICGAPPVDPRVVQQGYDAVYKLCFGQLCKQARDQIGEAPKGLERRWKEYEARAPQEIQKARAQIAIWMPQLQLAERQLAQGRYGNGGRTRVNAMSSRR